MRAALYARVSTDQQKDDGTSLSTQELACREFAAARGWEIILEVQESKSGFTLERPGLAEIRELASRGRIDVVLAYALDRLSRKQTHVAILVEEMEAAGVTLEFVTESFEDTATGQLLRSVKAFAAEFEREKIAERTMRGKAERARSGRLPQATGRGTFGYSYDSATGKRVIDPNEGPVVLRIFQGFVEGESIIGMANRLNDEGVPTKHGKRWSPATLFHLLRNESYSGRTTYRRTQAVKLRDAETGQKKRKVIVRPESEWIDVPGGSPAIVPEAIFLAARRRLDDPERLRLGRRKSTYGLAGHIKCKVCGSAMVGQTLRGQYRYYRCRRAFAGPKTDRCISVYVRADGLEASLLAGVASMLARPDIVRSELRRLAATNPDAERAGSLSVRLEALSRQRERLLKLYQLGQIDDEYLQREAKPLAAERDRIEAELAALRRPALMALPDDAALKSMCSAISDWLQTRGQQEFPLIANALQLTVRAEKGSAEIQGIVPEYAPNCDDAYVRPMVNGVTNSPSFRCEREPR